MEVTLKLLSPFKPPSGKREIHIECPGGINVADFFRIVEEKAGPGFLKSIFKEETDKLRGNVSVCLQREGLSQIKRIELFEGLETPLQSNDVLLIFHPVSGG